MSILRYLFPVLLYLFLKISPSAAEQPDTLFRPSLIAGMDVSGFARQLMEPDTRQWEWSLSAELRPDLFASLEAGFLDIGIQRPSHNYSANGWFFRAGVDYNLLERNERNLHDLVLLIFRYGYGNLQHQSTNIIIQNPYWGDYLTSLSPETFHAHWLELGAGIRARIFADFFMGWSIRTRLVVSQTSEPEMDPFIISGFGRTTRNPNVMIHYSIYYRFPL